MTRNKNVVVHYRPRPGEWTAMRLQVQQREDDSRQTTHYKGMPERFDVIFDGETIGSYTRHPRHRTHQVHGRIRYDNKPRTRFQAAALPGKMGHLWRDTRVEALADIIEQYLGVQWIVDGAHVEGRCPKWLSCVICDGSEV